MKMMKHTTFGILAILALLAFGTCARADSMDTFLVNGDLGGETFDLAAFSVPSSSIPADGVYYVNGGCGKGCGGTVAGVIGGISTTFSVYIIGPYGAALDMDSIYMVCNSGLLVCQAEITLGLAGTYTISPPSGPPFDQPMNFIPGVYDGGDLVITDPASTPEPATLLLMAAGLIALAFFRRRFPQQMRQLPSRI
jgi:hypothetical protein